MSFPYEETGSRILFLRKERGWTREQLAEQADISVQFLADIEKGRKNMTVTTLRKISKALFVTTDTIVNGNKQITEKTEEEIIDLFRSIPEEKRPAVIKLIRVFLETIE